MAFSAEQFNALGYAVRSGMFDDLTAEQQLRIFERGYGDDPKELNRLAKHLTGKDLVKFDPKELIKLADKEIERRKAVVKNTTDLKSQPEKQEQTQNTVDNNIPSLHSEEVAAANVNTALAIANNFIKSEKIETADNNSAKVLTNTQKTEKPKITVVYPIDYGNYTPRQKVDFIRKVCYGKNVKFPYDPFAGRTSNDEKRVIVSKNVKFLDDNTVNQLEEFQLNSLHNIPFILHHELMQANALNVTEPELVEIPLSDSEKIDYDIGFITPSRDQSKTIKILFNTFPVFDNDHGWGWINKRSVKSIRIRWNKALKEFIPSKDDAQVSDKTEEAES